ncbi:MAG: response regulator [Desulfococcaceae bacterium]|jgi:DNA-binding NtrC family response regulator|nr:response regulator [Desulfococcaceae bacterium]
MTSNIKQVLVVDDQNNWRKALRILLENEGYRVSDASNSQNAKELIRSSDFGLAILDVRLIDDETLNMEGLDLLDFIKKESPVTKTIVLTGYPEGIGNTKPDNADDLILKIPGKSTFDIKGFQEKVKNLLNN